MNLDYQGYSEDELRQMQADIEDELEWRWNPPSHGPVFPFIGPIDHSFMGDIHRQQKLSQQFNEILIPRALSQLLLSRPGS